MMDWPCFKRLMLWSKFSYHKCNQVASGKSVSKFSGSNIFGELYVPKFGNYTYNTIRENIFLSFCIITEF